MAAAVDRGGRTPAPTSIAIAAIPGTDGEQNSSAVIANHATAPLPSAPDEPGSHRVKVGDS